MARAAPKMQPVRMTEVERLGMLLAQSKLDAVRAEAEKARLRFELEQASAELQMVRADAARMMSSNQYKAVVEAATTAERVELQAQRELAAKLAERYGIAWDACTWSPETGDITQNVS